MNSDVLASRHCFVRATDRRDSDVTALTDISYHEPDFVGVTRDGNRRLATLDDCHGVSVVVDANLVGKLFDVLNPEPLTGRLETRRRRSLEQLV
jgi:hypothetical protein